MLSVGIGFCGVWLSASSDFMICFFCRPSAAVSSAIEVKDGDLLVIASDGLFNNMYKSELTQLLHNFKVLCMQQIASL